MEVNSRKNNWLTLLTTSIFVTLLIIFALYTRMGVSPDGIDHLNFSIKGIPKINLIGPATEDFPIKYVHFYSTGYGYHYFVHLLYKLLEKVSFNSINETNWCITPFLSQRDLEIPTEKENLLLIMRLLSVIFTCLQVYFLKKICEILQIDYIYPITMLWLSFSIMFPFLHSNASRDVLINLLSICFIYNILSFHAYHKDKNLKFALLILAIGPFVQLSLAALLVTVLVSYAILYPKKIWELIRSMFQVILFKKGYIFPILLGIVALPATADITNKIIQYKSIRPGCEQMFSFEECREENATYRTYHHLKKLREKRERIGISEYFSKWYPGLYKRIFGIMGHQSYGTTNKITHILIGLITLLFIISTCFNIKARQKSLLFIGMITVLYLTVLFFYVNRKTYLFTGQFNAALQGRYMFPIYPLLITYAHSSLPSLQKTGYYAYIFFLFGFLTSIYYLFLASPRFESIMMVQ